MIWLEVCVINTLLILLMQKCVGTGSFINYYGNIDIVKAMPAILICLHP